MAEGIGSFLQHPYGCWKRKFLKNAILSTEKQLGQRFLGFRIWQISATNQYGSTKFSDKYCASYKVISVTHEKLLKTQSFAKKGKVSSEKKLFGLFFLVLSNLTKVKKQFEGA